MNIVAKDVSKRFRFDWIFKSFDKEFVSGKRYAITGPNGSGKSTLVKILGGFEPASKGEVTFVKEGVTLTPDEMYRFISFAAPYQEIVEELTLKEAVEFHSNFCPEFDMEYKDFVDRIGLAGNNHKLIQNFSSGMKQRLKLGFALFTKRPIIVLDEPTVTLDRQGVEWYLNEVNQVEHDRLLIIASNIPEEYAFCDEVIQISDYKVN